MYNKTLKIGLQNIGLSKQCAQQIAKGRIMRGILYNR